jgi:hypothetical protein
MVHFTWSAEKNQQLQRERGLSFEEIVAAIEADGLLKARIPGPLASRHTYRFGELGQDRAWARAHHIL